MNDTSAALAVLVGLGVRLFIPILVTGLIILALSRMDRGWQTDARIAQVRVAKPECWKFHACQPAKRQDCPAFRSSQPCWQVFRLSNGYLDQKCLGCPVLVHAPRPVHI